MKLFESMATLGHEQVVCCYDKSTGYKGIIAIHDTTLGPALGGTRFWNYANDDEAITDALRLSRGMTYKNAVAGLNLGGGKSVIIGDNRTQNRELIFRAHGRFVESLGGRYVTAEDVGTGTGDMDYVHMETEYVAGLANRSGDPSPVTAHGVFRSIEASAQSRWGSKSLAGKTIIVQYVPLQGTACGGRQAHRRRYSQGKSRPHCQGVRRDGGERLGDLLAESRSLRPVRAGCDH
jgi:leucine dehydrogenase